MPQERTPQTGHQQNGNLPTSIKKIPSNMQFYWQNSGVNGRTAVKLVRASGQFEKKSVLCVFWNYEGVIPSRWTYHEFRTFTDQQLGYNVLKNDPAR